MKVEPISQLKARPRGKPLTFGDFVAGVYHTWGNRRAKGIIRLAVALGLIEFRGPERLQILEEDPLARNVDTHPPRRWSTNAISV